MSNSQSFRSLSDQDESWLSDQRECVEALINGNPDAENKYKTSAGKLGTIRAILEANVFQADETFKLQGLGIVLGDALASEIGLVWKMSVDDDGESPCLVKEGTSIVIFPQTMISKRIERGEEVDVFYLFNATFNHVEDLLNDGVD